jgi:hypothetical protein
MTFREELVEQKACSEALDWVGDKTLIEAWEQCEQAQWMLWLACRRGVSRIHLHNAAHACIDNAPVHDNLFAKNGIEYARGLANDSLRSEHLAERAVYAALRSCWKAAEYPPEGYWPCDDEGTYSGDRAALDKRFCDVIRLHLPIEHLLAPTLASLAEMGDLLK